MPFRHARARPPDCISIIGQIHRDLHVRHHNEIGEVAKYSYNTALRDITALVERGENAGWTLDSDLEIKSRDRA